MANRMHYLVLIVFLSQLDFRGNHTRIYLGVKFRENACDQIVTIFCQNSPKYIEIDISR